MVPTSGALPELRSWTPDDAALAWKYRGEEKGFEVLCSGLTVHGRLLTSLCVCVCACVQVRGYDRKLEVVAHDEQKDPTRKQKLVGKLSRFLGKKRGEKLKRFAGYDARAPPTGGDPSILAGEEVATEGTKRLHSPRCCCAHCGLARGQMMCCT